MRRVAALVGARPGEAVVMNSLTVNLHLMLGSFYRPTAERYQIVIETDVFPSDRYAVMGVARAAMGFDPVVLPAGDVVGFLDREGASVAVVVLSAIDFRTGALLDIPGITDAAHRAGALMGWDLAHAAGNVPLQMHDWDVDFAVWCHYKYVNAGPGAVGGCFVHERHGNDPAVLRPGGWWGHDPASRFAMPFGFDPVPGAEGWQVSQPADPGDGPGARVAGPVRRGRDGGAARAERAPDRVPGATARRRRIPATGRGDHAAGP